jgi:ABC-type transport system substrate-binding protein
MRFVSKSRAMLVFGFALILTSVIACGEKIVEVPVEVPVEVEVIREVVVTQTEIVEVEVPVVVEVEKQVVVEVEKQVVVEVTKEVVVEVEVEVEKIVEVPVTKVVEVEVQSGKYPIAGSELILAVQDVAAKTSYKRSLSPEPAITYPMMIGMAEHLLDYDGNSYAPMIAKAWEWNEERVIFTIRDDVPWHDSKYGYVEGDDFLWSYAESVATNNGWISEYFGPFYQNHRVEGDQLIWDWKASPNLNMFHPARHMYSAIEAQSKRYFEDMGEAHVMENGMLTGPYKLVEHSSDDYIKLEGVKNHWRVQPGFERLELIEVTEPATRIAMLLSGDVHGTEVSINLVDQVADMPGVSYWEAGMASGSGATIRMGGNWQLRELSSYHPNAGDPSPSTYRDDLPWVGDINDPVDMENARLIRKAMSMAIDRELLNDAIFGGLGCIGFTIQSVCDPHHQDQWFDEYDPETAAQMIIDAGYPDGFTVDYRLPSDNTTSFIELGEAVGNMWEEIGLTVAIDTRMLGGYEEFVEGKQVNSVFIRAGGSFWVASSLASYSAPYSASIDWGEGFDFPEALDIHTRFMSTTDLDVAWDLTIEMFDTMWEQRFVLGTVFWKDPFVTSDVVRSADMDNGPRSGIPEVESLRP